MTTKGAGRAIGVMFLAQMSAAFVVNFVWLAKVFSAPGFLVNAAAHPFLMGLPVERDLFQPLRGSWPQHGTGRTIWG
jgi:hypothetical protein